MQQKRLILALLAGVAMSGAAQAALHDRGGGLIYDDVLNITWLQDANYAQTSGYDTDGLMFWPDAMAWADTLSYHDSVRGVTYDDWRLPTALNQDGTGPCGGYNCTSSEMGHLFYVDGGLSAGQSILASTTLDDYFTNMQSSVYWSGTEYAPDASGAWVFGTGHGGQRAGSEDFDLYAWAVRPGDVAAVPEADTWAMLLAGLGLVGVAARQRRG